MTDYLIAASKS